MPVSNSVEHPLGVSTTVDASSSSKKKTPENRSAVTHRVVCYAYLRVSTAEQVDSGLGLAAQLASIEAYATRQGYELAHVFRDEGISGASPVSERPGLSSLLSSLTSPAVVLVAKRDRLGRDAFLVRMIEIAIEGRGSRVESAAGEGNGEEPADKLMRTIIDGFSEFERDQIKARTKAALNVKRTRGERIGEVPFGYQLAADGIHLEKNPTEQKAIQQARAHHAAGYSLREVAELLKDAGLVSRTGKPFQATQIKRMVNP